MLWGRYASCREEARYPELWEGLRGLWVPAAGITGSRLYDLAGSAHAAMTNQTWSIVNGAMCLVVNGTNTSVVATAASTPTTGLFSVVVCCTVNNIVSGRDNVLFDISSGLATQPGCRLAINPSGGIHWFAQDAAGVIGAYGATPGSIVGTGVSLVIAGVHAAGVWRTYLNAVQVGSASGGQNATSFTRVSLGSYNGGGVASISMTASVLYERPLSVGELMLIQSIGPLGILEPRSHNWLYVPRSGRLLSLRRKAVAA